METSYEALDHIFGVDAKEDDKICLQKVGDIFTLEVDHQVDSVSGLRIKIPPVWCTCQHTCMKRKTC